MFWCLLFISFLGGFLVGYLVREFWKKRHPKMIDGILHVDTMNVEKDVYTFEMITPVNNITSERLFTLKVENDNYSSQK